MSLYEDTEGSFNNANKQLYNILAGPYTRDLLCYWA